MRYLPVLLLLLPIGLFAQDCQLKSKKDPYTKEIKISTGFLELEGGMISIQASKTEIDFMISVPGGKCFDDGTTVNMFFDNTKLKSNYKNTGTMNCEGLFHFTFKNSTATPTPLQNLASKKVTTIQFKTKEDYTAKKKDKKDKDPELTLTPEQQQQFMDMVTCMIKESKTLLQ
jgi:hypothetical protein